MWRRFRLLLLSGQIISTLVIAFLLGLYITRYISRLDILISIIRVLITRLTTLLHHQVLTRDIHCLVCYFEKEIVHWPNFPVLTGHSCLTAPAAPLAFFDYVLF